MIEAVLYRGEISQELAAKACARAGHTLYTDSRCAPVGVRPHDLRFSFGLRAFAFPHI
jgi:hypothetical protein